MQKVLRRLRQQDGFTLLEVLVVIAILGIIAAIITPKFMDTLAESRANTAVASGKQIQVAMERWNFAHNAYPATAAIGSLDSVAATGLMNGTNLLGNYINSVNGLAWPNTAANGYVASGTPPNIYEMHLYITNSISGSKIHGQCVEISPSAVTLIDASVNNDCALPTP